MITYDYLSMLKFKLNHFIKMGPGFNVLTPPVTSDSDNEKPFWSEAKEIPISPITDGRVR